MKYEVTRLFTKGIFKGKTYTEITSVKFEEGFVCKNAIGGSDYKIISCKPV